MSELFNGTWRLDAANSKVWDAKTENYAPDEVGEEIMTIAVKNGVEKYEVLYGDDPIITMGYTAKYDDHKWVPYEVRNITHKEEGSADESMAAFRQRINSHDGSGGERKFEVGKIYCYVRTIYVDPRTNYRVGKGTDDGQAQDVMLRRLASDGQSFVATVLHPNGRIYRVRTFVRS